MAGIDPSRDPEIPLEITEAFKGGSEDIASLLGCLFLSTSTRRQIIITDGGMHGLNDLREQLRHGVTKAVVFLGRDNSSEWALDECMKKDWVHLHRHAIVDDERYFELSESGLEIAEKLEEGVLSEIRERLVAGAKVVLDETVCGLGALDVQDCMTFWACVDGLGLLMSSSDEDEAHGGFSNYFMSERFWRAFGTKFGPVFSRGVLGGMKFGRDKVQAQAVARMDGNPGLEWKMMSFARMHPYEMDVLCRFFDEAMDLFGRRRDPVKLGLPDKVILAGGVHFREGDILHVSRCEDGSIIIMEKMFASYTSDERFGQPPPGCPVIIHLEPDAMRVRSRVVVAAPVGAVWKIGDQPWLLCRTDDRQSLFLLDFKTGEARSFDSPTTSVVRVTYNSTPGQFKVLFDSVWSGKPVGARMVEKLYSIDDDGSIHVVGSEVVEGKQAVGDDSPTNVSGQGAEQLAWEDLISELKSSRVDPESNLIVLSTSGHSVVVDCELAPPLLKKEAVDVQRSKLRQAMTTLDVSAATRALGLGADNIEAAIFPHQRYFREGPQDSVGRVGTQPSGSSGTNPVRGVASFIQALCEHQVEHNSRVKDLVAIFRAATTVGVSATIVHDLLNKLNPELRSQVASACLAAAMAGGTIDSVKVILDICGELSEEEGKKAWEAHRFRNEVVNALHERGVKGGPAPGSPAEAYIAARFRGDFEPLKKLSTGVDVMKMLLWDGDVECWRGLYGAGMTQALARGVGGTFGGGPFGCECEPLVIAAHLKKPELVELVLSETGYDVFATMYTTRRRLEVSSLGLRGGRWAKQNKDLSRAVDYLVPEVFNVHQEAVKQAHGYKPVLDVLNKYVTENWELGLVGNDPVSSPGAVASPSRPFAFGRGTSSPNVGGNPTNPLASTSTGKSLFNFDGLSSSLSMSGSKQEPSLTATTTKASGPSSPFGSIDQAQRVSPSQGRPFNPFGSTNAPSIPTTAANPPRQFRASPFYFSPVRAIGQESSTANPPGRSGPFSFTPDEESSDEES